ncbi:Receptor protein 12 [Spatholobus suberectus]|nr:Receptor protein 12 [Spatholobus suberectus]
MESWIQWLLLCWHLLFFHFSPSHSLCHPHDSFALLQFKNSFTIDTNYDFYNCHPVYPKTTTWENGTDCCSWPGVTCHPFSGHVIGLDLACSGLLGQIHPNSTLFHLSHLQSLNLAFNGFYQSHLSSLFGGFVSLTHLNLSGSNFEGEIPSQISHLSKLASLDLSFQEYTDSVTVTTKAISMTMDKIRRDFVSIDLSRNRFEGEIPNIWKGFQELCPGEVHCPRDRESSKILLNGKDGIVSLNLFYSG